MTETKAKKKITTVKIEYYKLCPACGNFSNVYEKQDYCIVCGKKLIEKCSNCNEPIIYPTAKYCHKCGKAYKNRKPGSENNN